MRNTYVVLASFVFSSVAHASSVAVAESVPAAALAAQASRADTRPAAIVSAPTRLVLPADTDLVVTPDKLLTSKTLRSGNKFDLSTAADVIWDGYVVIPRGTVGEGTVTYRKKSGSFGKPGTMEVQFSSLILNGQRIGLTGSYRQEGQGNGGAVVGAVVAFGLVGGLLVKGHAAQITNGQQLHARTTEALNFTVPTTAVASIVSPKKAEAPAPTK
jgi:hypothetical protein